RSRRTANAAQRILDLVGQGAHQRAGGFLVGQLGFFLADTQQAVARQHFQQQQGFAAREDRRYRVVDGQRLAAYRRQGGLALGEGVCLVDCLAQRRQSLGGFGEQFADEL